MIRLTILLMALAHPAGAFDLRWPLDCVPGTDCRIQNYVDRDQGPAIADFTCGPLSYDGHDGTDIALGTLADMEAGVNVLAAAPGRVRGTRDGMPDISVRDPAAPPLEGRDCGNGVAIDHGDGWETQYCHMRRGSIAVREGDMVQAGDVLGQVGLSGNTEFPHLHLAVRRDGAELDPFEPGGDPACGASVPTLWSATPAYNPGGLIDIGIATAVPEYEAIKMGLPDETIARDAPALVIWAYYFGPRAGDVLDLRVTGPGGEVTGDRITLDRTQALAFRATGRRLREALAQGSYTGIATLSRDGTELGRMETTFTVGP
jgi:Peptidase family M23